MLWGQVHVSPVVRSPVHSWEEKQQTSWWPCPGGPVLVAAAPGLLEPSRRRGHVRATGRPGQATPVAPWENREGRAVGRPARSQETAQSQHLAEKGLSQRQLLSPGKPLQMSEQGTRWRQAVLPSSPHHAAAAPVGKRCPVSPQHSCDF